MLCIADSPSLALPSGHGFVGHLSSVGSTMSSAGVARLLLDLFPCALNCSAYASCSLLSIWVNTCAGRVRSVGSASPLVRVASQASSIMA